MTELMTREEALTLKIWQREAVLRERKLPPVEPLYCIVWEDPIEPDGDLDAPVHITTPSPEWLAMALHGNILPPASVYPLPVDENGTVIEGNGLHDDVIEAMSEEQAMEYLLQKDVPVAVWDAPTGNRRRFVITNRKSIPTDRDYRNAWRIAA